MRQANRSNYFLFSIGLLFLTYAFGTFGFFNLFDVRILAQVAGLAVILPFFVRRMYALQPGYKFPTFLFCAIFAVGSLAHGYQFVGALDAIIIACTIVIILSAPVGDIVTFSKVLVVIATVLNGLVATAFTYYQLNPEEFFYANFHIYDSTVGTSAIYPEHFMDWVSFTSGDGYEFLGESRQRMKGYSNEPSSTPVHYLAPAIIGFFLGGAYIYCAIFMLLVNIVGIAAVTTHAVVAVSVVALLGIVVARWSPKLVLIIGVTFAIVFLLSPSSVNSLFVFLGDEAIRQYEWDLISRKVGDGAGESSLSLRQEGISGGLALTVLSPLGYSQSELGPGAGLLYLVSSRTGWIGTFIFCAFLYRFAGAGAAAAKAGKGMNVQYAISLLAAQLVIALLVSGYGWDRPPGVVMLLLFFRWINFIGFPENRIENANLARMR